MAIFHLFIEFKAVELPYSDPWVSLSQDGLQGRRRARGDLDDTDGLKREKSTSHHLTKVHPSLLLLALPPQPRIALLNSSSGREKLLIDTIFHCLI